MAGSGFPYQGFAWENCGVGHDITANKSTPEQVREHLFIPGASPANKELTVPIVPPPPCDAIPGLAASPIRAHV